MEKYHDYVDADLSSTAIWSEGATYLSGEIVYHQGMLWKAMDDITIDNSPDEWLDVDGDDINDNPWKILYPWNDDDTATIIISKKLHDGDGWVIDMDLFNQTAMSINDDNKYLKGFKLSAPYPNPFNPVTRIEYNLSRVSNIALTIHDLRGRQVEMLKNGIHFPGNYAMIWDASNYSSGIYFIRMVLEEYSQTQKLILVK